VDPVLPGLSFHPIYKGIWGNANRWKRAALYLQGTVLALWDAIRADTRICHLHFFQGAPEELLVLCLAKLSGRRVVLTVHDVESFAGHAPRGFIRRIYRLADRFVVHNQTSRSELISVLGIDPGEITVIAHGNYLDTLGRVPSASEARQTLGIPEQAKVVLFFGQIKEVKGLDLLLQATREVAARVPDVVLLIAGRPWKNHFSSYEQQINELGIAALCRLHIRFIADEEIGTFYAATDVVVLPYRRIYQSGVVLLAMSYGKAVLVSDLPGMTEIIRDRETGYTFTSGSAASLTKALEDVLSDELQRLSVAERGLSFVASYHDWTRIGAQTAELYESL
jgi:glycosyltransferase involved in cell wall biosynthesis